MKRIPFIFLIAALVLTACGAAAATAMPSVVDMAPMPAAGAPEAQRNLGIVAQAPQTGDATANQANIASANPLQPRIVLQNADLAVVVKDPQAKMNEIGAMALRLGGFVVTSNMGQTYNGGNVKVLEGSISIRVPAKDIETALGEIKANTVEVQSENRSGEDVTDKYVDFQSQLKAKQAAADKLFEILQKTDKTEDTMLVFNQLDQVQSDIEVLKGQINLYEQAAALSLISVRLIAEETIKPIEIAGWQPQGVARNAVQSLIDFFQGFASFLIWLVIFIIPVAAVIILLLALLWRLLRWFWRKVFPRKSPPPAAPLAPAE